MNIEDFSEKEIEQVVNSFKAYIKLVANHATINYAKKIKSQKYKVISLDELVEKEVSLSREDNGIFSFENDSENIFTNEKYAKAFKKLTKKEPKVLILYSKRWNVFQISKIMRITENNVKVTKSIAINKFKKLLGEIEDNENK